MPTYRCQNDDCQNNEVEHVAPRVVVVEDEGAESNQSTIIVDENCSNCEHYRDELNNLLIIVNEMKKKQDEDRGNSESEMAKTDAKLKSLIEDNNKMAAEIQALKINVEETSHDNAVIRSVLDIKQGEWTKIEHSKSTDKKVTESANNNIIQSYNRFEALDDENEEEASDGNQINSDVNAQISNYRAKQQEKFVKSRDAKQPKVAKEKPKMDSPAKEEERMPTLEPSKESIDLVIGDSMVKNIDNMKLTRAAKKRTVCHSYSGATVVQIAAKFDEHVKEESSYGRVIIHVGTNDLARTQPNRVIKNMEALITKVKTKAKEVAVSGIIKRYDNKVKPNNINSYNNLLHKLCIKHKISYIDNECIVKSMLNTSNLHLNKNGDRALGSAFCTLHETESEFT